MPGPKENPNAAQEGANDDLAQANTDLQAKIDALETEKAETAGVAQENANLLKKVADLEKANTEAAKTVGEEKSALETKIAELEEAAGDNEDEALKARIEELEAQVAERDMSLKAFITAKGDEIPVIGLQNHTCTRSVGKLDDKGKPVKDKAGNKVKEVKKTVIVKGKVTTVDREELARLTKKTLPCPIVQVHLPVE